MVRPFDHSRCLLTEGIEDAAFLRALIEARNIQPFNVRPTSDLGGVGGKTGFETAMRGCEAQTGFDQVSAVVLVSDNDEDPAASVQVISDQIQEARGKGNARDWGHAMQPEIWADGDPSVALWMWPQSNQVGCLETLLWSVIRRIHPGLAGHIEHACRESGADQWETNQRDKARVRCFLALGNRRDPALGLGRLWNNRPDLIPLNSPEFNQISDFLSGV